MYDINEVIGCIVRYDHCLNMSDMQDSDITNLKLQKLLYYSQGHYLAEFGKELFQDDIVAWKHGPVVSSIYYQFRDLMAEGASDYIGFSVVENDIYNHPRISNNKEQFDFFIKLMAYYNQYSPWGLRNMTHKETPWLDTKNGEVINKALIKEFFSQPEIANRLSV